MFVNFHETLTQESTKMPKSNQLQKSPVSLHKSSKTPAKKTVRRSVRRTVPLRIVPPRHLIKSIWANRTAEQLEQAKKIQRTYCCNQTFQVQSATTMGREYEISCGSDGAWTCTCGDFMYRSSKNQSHYGFYCKHIAKCIDIVLDKNI